MKTLAIVLAKKEDLPVLNLTLPNKINSQVWSETFSKRRAIEEAEITELFGNLNLS